MLEVKIIALLVAAVITISAAAGYIALRIDAAAEKERSALAEDLRYRNERVADLAAARRQAARPARTNAPLSKIGK